MSLFLLVLVAAAGLGIDTASMASARSHTQHGADAGVLAIANDCIVNGSSACTANATTKATYYANENATSTDTPSVSFGSTSVTVALTKPVDTKFFNLIGISSKTVAAQATAGYFEPKTGKIPPFLVSLCDYVNPGLNQPAFLQADMPMALDDANLQDDPQSNLDPFLRSCNSIPTGVDAASNTRMVKGGLWKNKNDADNCNMSIESGKASYTLGQSSYGWLCGNSFNHLDSYTDNFPVGSVVLLAIIAPNGDNDHYSGVLTNTGAPYTGTNVITQVPGNTIRFDTKIVGLAPFKVTGIQFKKNTCVAGGTCSNGAQAYGSEVYGIWGQWVSAVSADVTEWIEAGPNIGSVARLID